MDTKNVYTLKLHCKTMYLQSCTASEVSDQLAQLCSLISLHWFAGQSYTTYHTSKGTFSQNTALTIMRSANYVNSKPTPRNSNLWIFKSAHESNMPHNRCWFSTLYIVCLGSTEGSTKQRRLQSDCTDVQSDQSSHCFHMTHILEFPRGGLCHGMNISA